jgi:hypothetical protein
MELKVGQVVYRYHDTGAMGVTPVFGEVVRVNRMTITVRWEGGNTWRIEPQHLTPVWEGSADEIRREYLQEEKDNYVND